ncbi:MAG TPA: SDR family oxidoreductase [Solirubrobacteraceae bacterium]
MSLDGRRVLITGGSSGIGAALAEVCVQRGARVGIIGRDERRLGEVASRTGAVAVAADITTPADCDRAVAAISDQLDGIDALVNNAGAMLHSRISAGVVEDWEQMIAVNVLGLLYITHATLPHLRAADHADVVNVSSIAADRISVPDFAVYGATKAMVLRLTEALRADLGEKDDIRVSMIKPGTTNTEGFGPGIRDVRLRSQVEALKQRTGMDPRAVSEQICHLIAAPRSVCVAEMVLIPHQPMPSGSRARA